MTTASNDSPRRGLGLREWALHDWLIVGFLTLLVLLALVAPDHPRRTAARLATAGLWLLAMTTTALLRGRWLQGSLATTIYRIGFFGSVQLSYFALGPLLATLHDSTIDSTLYQLDLALFGTEPAVDWLSWSTPPVVETFAFFYYCYFTLILIHVAPTILWGKHQPRTGEFLLGMSLVFVCGHLGYLTFPAMGPVVELAGTFPRPLEGGFWWELVQETVASGGSKLDCFPSVHTAMPAFLTLLSFRHRDADPFRFTWLPLGIAALMIMGATMLLRWHWLIDVVAGLLLAGTLALLVPWLVERENQRRRQGYATSAWGC